MKDIICNDKFLVTVSVTILGICSFAWSVITGVSAENIVTAIVAGLFGMAAGRGMARSEDIRKPDPPVKP
jgi:thiamine monophosphate synthase